MCVYACMRACAKCIGLRSVILVFFDHIQCFLQQHPYIKRVIIPLPCIELDMHYVRQFVIVVSVVPLIAILKWMVNIID